MKSCKSKSFTLDIPQQLYTETTYKTARSKARQENRNHGGVKPTNNKNRMKAQNFKIQTTNLTGEQISWMRAGSCIWMSSMKTNYFCYVMEKFSIEIFKSLKLFEHADMDYQNIEIWASKFIYDTFLLPSGWIQLPQNF